MKYNMFHYFYLVLSLRFRHSHTLRKPVWVLGPDGRLVCFFVATDVILPGGKFLWHYGLFHGIHKNYYDNDDESDESDESAPDHYEDDLRMAQQLSLDLNGPSPQECNEQLVTDPKPAKKNRAVLQGVKKGVNLSKKNIVKSREQKLEEEEKERLRMDAVSRYESGQLQFVPRGSPQHSQVPHCGDGILSEQFQRDLAGVAADMAVANPNEDPRDDSDNDSDISSEAETPLRNESQIEAEESQKVRFELSSMSAQEIWDGLFSNKKLKGGTIARSLFIAARMIDSKVCEPWSGSKILCTKKADLADQRKLFLQWAGEIRVLRWVRSEIFTKVVSHPRTYKLLDVKHADFIGMSHEGKEKMTLSAVEATDDTMARIAHLACTSESRSLLHMIYGPKTREYVDQSDLQAPALWQDLASQFVNNADWHFFRPTCQSVVGHIDPTNFPNPGITGDCVRECFTSIKAMFSTLSNAVFGRTGCNSTGAELYDAVWKNYINGKYLYFARPEVAMYTFKLWLETDTLPKYCIKELHPDAAVRAGVVSNAPFALPVTPRSSSSGLMSPATSSTASLDKLAQYLDLESAVKRQRFEMESKQPKVHFLFFFIIFIVYKH
jgi:hypothetical protein